MKVSPHLFMLLVLAMLCGNGTAVVASWQVDVEAEASGSAFARVPTGSGSPGLPLAFRFQPLFPGQYQVWIRYRHELEDAGTLRFRWNEQPEEQLLLEPATHWTWVKLGSWTFLFGDHTLELRDVTEEVGLDRLFITPHPDKVPMAEGPHVAGAAPGQTHELWAHAFEWVDPERDSPPTSDPDGDGLCNALERFFGSNPLASSARPLQVAKDEETGEWVCRFERTRAASEMSSLFQVSTDLVHWFAPATIRSIATSRSETMDGIELRVDPGGQSTLYLRLDLSQETP
jgi:hypothetical protein